MDSTVMHINKGNAHGTQGERSNGDNSDPYRLLNLSKSRSKSLKAILMSSTRALFSDKARSFSQSERALYGNFLRNHNMKKLSR